VASVVDGVVVRYAGQQPHDCRRPSTLCGLKSRREGRGAQGVAARVSCVECAVYTGLLGHLLHICHADLGATEFEVIHCRWRALIFINSRRTAAVKVIRYARFEN
jgi:hypothetical protein